MYLRRENEAGCKEEPFRERLDCHDVIVIDDKSDSEAAAVDSKPYCLR